MSEIGEDHRPRSVQPGLEFGYLQAEISSVVVGDPRRMNWITPKGKEEQGDEGEDEPN